MGESLKLITLGTHRSFQMSIIFPLPTLQQRPLAMRSLPLIMLFHAQDFFFFLIFSVQEGAPREIKRFEKTSPETIWVLKNSSGLFGKERYVEMMEIPKTHAPIPFTFLHFVPSNPINFFFHSHCYPTRIYVGLIEWHCKLILR